jgi:small subunit ribosomal protein S16
MVKIRLRRTGAKKQPHYRVVVTESRSPRDGRFLETIGHYNPRTEPPTVEIDAERALYWLSVGAQPSEAVRRMLDKMGIMAQVPAVRKGEVSIDEILAELALTKEKAAEAEAVAEEEIEAEEAEAVAVAEEEIEAEEAEEEEVEPAAEADLEADLDSDDEEDDDEEDEDDEADEDDEDSEDSEDWDDEDEDDWDDDDSDDWDDDDADDVDDDQAAEDEE